MKIWRKLLPSVDRCIEAADQFEVEGDILPYAEGIYEWLVRKGFWA